MLGFILLKKACRLVNPCRTERYNNIEVSETELTLALENACFLCIFGLGCFSCCCSWVFLFYFCFLYNDRKKPLFAQEENTACISSWIPEKVWKILCWLNLVWQYRSLQWFKRMYKYYIFWNACMPLKIIYSDTISNKVSSARAIYIASFRV